VKATVAIELDGCAFTLDADAFGALRAYLDKAGERLGDHPDRSEVLAGLERSIAANLGRHRDAQNPIDKRELTAALAAVGRVDGPALGGTTRGAGARPRMRRLFRIGEGRKIAGVCAGLAAFAGIDVSLVRLGFILGAFFSGGILIVAYIALALVMPIARTPEEIAAAHGGPITE